MEHSGDHQNAPAMQSDVNTAQNKAEKNQPFSVLRDGNIKATTWRNEGENGPNFNTTFTRTWKDDKGQYQNSQSFSGGELLRLSELVRESYRDIMEFRRKHVLNPTPDQTPQEIERDQRQYGTRRQEFQDKRAGGENRQGRSKKR